jgi:hypothetical protein
VEGVVIYCTVQHRRKGWYILYSVQHRRKGLVYTEQHRVGSVVGDMQYGREGWVYNIQLGEYSGKYAIGRGLKYTEGECVVRDMQYEREGHVIYNRGGSAP